MALWFAELFPKNLLQFSNSAIQQFSNSTIQQFSNSTIQQFSNSAIQQFSNSTIQQFYNSTIQQFNKLKPQQSHSFLTSQIAMRGIGGVDSETIPILQRSIHQRRDCRE